MPTVIRSVCVSLLLLLPLLAHAHALTGKVTRVLDGDTLEVLGEDLKLHRIRLAGIDAPETGQAFGARAKQKLLALVGGEAVAVEWDKRDKYGRVVGKLVDADQDVNLALIRAGLAWWYRKYAAEQSAVDRLLYETAEEQARTTRVGLWDDASPNAPWDWRHRPSDPAQDAKICACDSGQVCVGKRGGHYCVRPGGGKKYLARETQ